jgi:hypothetical protein
MQIICKCGNEINSGETSDKFYFKVNEGITTNGKFYEVVIKCNNCGRVRSRFIYV